MWYDKNIQSMHPYRQLLATQLNQLASGCGFESRCIHLTLRYRNCFEQGVPWHSANYSVKIRFKSMCDLTKTKYIWMYASLLWKDIVQNLVFIDFLFDIREIWIISKVFIKELMCHVAYPSLGILERKTHLFVVVLIVIVSGCSFASFLMTLIQSRPISLIFLSNWTIIK